MAQELPKKVRETLGDGDRSYYSVIITDSGPDHTFEFGKEDYTDHTMDVANVMPVALKEESHDTYKLKIGTNIVSVRKDNGDPQPISDDAPGAVNSFMKDLDPDNSIDAGHTTFVRLSEPSKYTDYDGLTVVKGKAARGPGQKRYITEIIKDINENSGPETTALFPRKLVTSIGKFNRFTPEKVLITDGQKESNRDFSDIVAQELGTYTNHRNNPEAQNIQLRNLKNLGVQILLKASGEYDVPEDVEPGSLKEALKRKLNSTIKPGLAKIGVKVPVNSFQPENIMYEVNGKFSKPKHPMLQGEQLFSYGSYNTPMDPFDGLDSRSSAAASAILVTTVITMFEALSFAMQPSLLQSPIIGDILNIVNSAPAYTKNSYPACVREGAKEFFGLGSIGSGIEGPLGGLASLGGAFVGAALNSIGALGGVGRFGNEPGYFNMMLRNLMRLTTYELVGPAAGALSAIGLGISSLNLNQVSNNSGLDIDRNPGISDDITNTLNTVRSILDSRLVGFMNVLATIGDITISVRAAGLGEPSGISHPGQTFDDGYEDIIYEPQRGRQENIKLATLPFKNNLSVNASVTAGYFASNRSLSWGSSTTPSLYILPNSINIAEKRLGGSDLIKNKMMKDQSVSAFDERRIKDQTVKEIEDDLDAAYVPFYFHDLRTNEIVSFHAFLENINDAFDVEYAESAGYGRIGKVYSYKNTNRSIGMSFKVVSTNPEDFDMMWWKINKLVTMIYPQYTAGRTIQTEEGNKFIQPFSQLPSSSPLIRIRLGDIIRNNFSKFALARLFGVTLGEEQFKIVDPHAVRGADITFANRPRDIDEYLNRIRSGNFQRLDTLVISIQNPGGELNFSSDSKAVFQEFVDGQYKPITLPSADYTIQIKDEVIHTPGAWANGGEYKEYAVTVLDSQGANGSIESSVGAIRTFIPLGTGQEFRLRVHIVPGNEVSIQNFALSQLTGIGATTRRRRGTTPASNSGFTLKLDPFWTQEANRLRGIAEDERSQALEVAAGNLESDVKKFFNSDTNPIFKAFDTTKGKGLAGFIKSLRFNWNDMPWSVDGMDNRAPKCCTVELEFAPVNDLNPGIDVNGFNSAPVYRVGSISNAVNNSVGEDKGDYESDLRNFNKKAKVTIKNPASHGLNAVAETLGGALGLNR